MGGGGGGGGVGGRGKRRPTSKVQGQENNSAKLSFVSKRRGLATSYGEEK